jgi:hypothetical protein
MKRPIGRALGVALSLVILSTLAVGAANPAAAHAASPRQSAVVLWSQASMPATVQPGHQAVITAHFRVTHTVHHAVFAVRLSGGLVARPATLSWGTITPNHWNTLSFVVSVPSWVHPAQYSGTVTLVRWSKIDADDIDLHRVGLPLALAIQVVNPPASVVTWSPSNLGRIVVLKGQTVTETASFVSSVALSNVQLGRRLSPYAIGQGVVVTPLGISPAATSIAPNTRYTVTFSIATAANTTAGLYGVDVVLSGSFNGGPVTAFDRSLHATLDVRRPEPTINWTPDGLGQINLTPGQTVTKTATFVSNVALSGVQLARQLPDAAASHGVSINLLGLTPATTAIAPNAPYTVTFTVAAAPTAPSGAYSGAVYLTGSVNGAAPARIWHQEGFVVNVAAPSPEVTWSSSGGPVSYPTITRGATTVIVTETATFNSNVALSNVTLAGSLSSNAAAQGITITPLAVPGGSVAAGASTTASFVLSVPPTATPGVHQGYLWVVGQPAGASAAREISHRLTFVFAVN